MGDRSSAGSGIQYPRFSLRVRTIKATDLWKKDMLIFYPNRNETYFSVCIEHGTRCSVTA